MDSLRFERLIAAYGADPARWPANERAAAERTTESEALAAGLKGARALDAALDAFIVEPPSPALRRRVLTHAPTVRLARGWRLTGAAWLSGASLLAACAVGVIAGVTLGGALPGVLGLVDRDADAPAAFSAATVFDAPLDEGRWG